MLFLWRRHVKSCPHAASGRDHTKCTCPIWCDGEVERTGQRLRKSLKTKDWSRAGRRLAEMEQAAEEGRERKPITAAVKAFLGHLRVEPTTLRKYRHIAGCLEKFCDRREIGSVDELTLSALDQYEQHRKLSALTWQKELQFLRSFFAFCLDRKWVTENVAKKKKMPREPKGRERVPYTSEEIAAILEACGRIGQADYERSRSRALVLLMLRYGLRVSDAALLARRRVQSGQIQVRAVKNGASLWAPLYDDVAEALAAVPSPMTADPDCPYYFWSGKGNPEGHVKTVIDSLAIVYRLSGVQDAHSHRFRHTLATELLSKGATVEDVANVLGDDPKTIRKHYKHWIPAYQARTVELLDRVNAEAHSRHVTSHRLQVVEKKSA